MEPREYRYQYGETVFLKTLHPDGSVAFSLGDRPLSLEDWNREVNRFQPMAVKENHPNPAIRWVEQHRRRLTLERCAPASHEVWVDVGCESGFLASALAPRCRRLIGVDVDQSLLDAAAERLAGARNVVLLRARADSVPSIGDGSVDGCLAAEILEHLTDVRPFLEEARRMLRARGRLIVTVPNDALVLALKRLVIRGGGRRLIRGLSDQLAIGHVRVWNGEGLARALAPLFEIREIELPFPYLNYFVTATRP